LAALVVQDNPFLAGHGGKQSTWAIVASKFNESNPDYPHATARNCKERLDHLLGNHQATKNGERRDSGDPHNKDPEQREFEDNMENIWQAREDRQIKKEKDPAKAKKEEDGLKLLEAAKAGLTPKRELEKGDKEEKEGKEEKKRSRYAGQEGKLAEILVAGRAEQLEVKMEIAKHGKLLQEKTLESNAKAAADKVAAKIEVEKLRIASEERRLRMTLEAEERRSAAELEKLKLFIEGLKK